MDPPSDKISLVLTNSWSAPLSAYPSYPCRGLRAQAQVRRLVWNYDIKVCIEPHTALSVLHMNSPFLKIRWTYQTYLVITANYSTKHLTYHQLLDTIWYLQFSRNSLQYNTSHLCQTIYKWAWKLCLKVSWWSHQTPLHLCYIPRPSFRTKRFYACMEVKCNSIPYLSLVHMTLEMMREILIHKLCKHGHTHIYITIIMTTYRNIQTLSQFTLYLYLNFNMDFTHPILYL
jgi:hypothetical protein